MPARPRAQSTPPPEGDGDETLQTPDEWAAQQGIAVMDHNGWAGTPTQDWFTPITEQEFNRRVALCYTEPVEDADDT